MKYAYFNLLVNTGSLTAETADDLVDTLMVSWSLDLWRRALAVESVRGHLLSRALASDDVRMTVAAIAELDEQPELAAAWMASADPTTALAVMRSAESNQRALRVLWRLCTPQQKVSMLAEYPALEVSSDDIAGLLAELTAPTPELVRMLAPALGDDMVAGDVGDVDHATLAVVLSYRRLSEAAAVWWELTARVRSPLTRRQADWLLAAQRDDMPGFYLEAVFRADEHNLLRAMREDMLVSGPPLSSPGFGVDEATTISYAADWPATLVSHALLHLPVALNRSTCRWLARSSDKAKIAEIAELMLKQQIPRSAGAIAELLSVLDRDIASGLLADCLTAKSMTVFMMNLLTVLDCELTLPVLLALRPRQAAILMGERSDVAAAVFALVPNALAMASLLTLAEGWEGTLSELLCSLSAVVAD